MEHTPPKPRVPLPHAGEGASRADGAMGGRLPTPVASPGWRRVPPRRLPARDGGSRWRPCALVAALALAPFAPFSGPAAAEPRVAVFDFELDNTSLAPSTPEELERTRRLGVQLRELLGVPGRYEVVDIAPVRDKIERVRSIRSCNGCELDAARQIGADVVAYGWVQKVSNLILNINLVIEDAKTGRHLRADSVDIRGNTDESWQRGLRYLINNRVFRAP